MTTAQSGAPDGERTLAATALGLLTGFLSSVRALWREHPAFTSAVAVALLINLVLLLAYLWSRGGQTTHVRIEANDDHFTVFVDGRLTTEATFLDAPAAGGISLAVGGARESVPSRPAPRGVDRVRVTDLATGALLFEDDFADGPKPAWEVSEIGFDNDHGVLTSQLRSMMTLYDRDWEDYAIDVTYRNVATGEIALRTTALSDGVFYTFRPFRHFDNQLSVRASGEPGELVTGPQLRLDPVETTKSIVAMALHRYPFAIELLAVGTIAVGALQLFDVRRLPFRPPPLRAPPDLPWLTISVISGGTFGVLLFLTSVYGTNMPHVPDAVSYIFQAKVLASGHLSVSPPPVSGAFDFFAPPFIAQNGDKWASIYPFGHPLVLAIGERVGAVWLVPPVIGAACVALIFVLGRRIYRSRVGLLAAVILASSPFFLMTGSNFMSHNTAVFYLLGALVCLAYVDKRPVLYGLLAGICFGLLFNTRPLTSLALMPPFTIYLLGLMAARERRGLGAQQVAAFLAGGLLILGAYWLYNWGTTGDAFSNGYQAGSNIEQGIGFGSKHSFTISAQHEQTQMALLLLVLTGWPQYIGLAFVLMPFVLGTRHRWDWFMVSCAVFVMAAYLLWRGNGVMHGPRYWYETLPFLTLLAARGADRAGDLIATGVGWFRRSLLGTVDPGLWAGTIVSYGLLLALVGGSIYGWLLSRELAWTARFVPAQAVELQGFNFTDDRIIRLVDDADLDNALVLVELCPQWWCYGSVFWLNSPTLDGNVVYAKNDPRYLEQLFRAYPDRQVYVATYSVPSLSPFAPEDASEPPPDDGGAPVAGDLVEALPTPTAGPAVPPPPGDPADAGKRDAQRQRDVATIADALQTYYARHDEYPIAVGLQSLCRYTDLDAGCQLEEVLDPLPVDPSPQGLYWYQSDRNEFVLYVVFEEEPPESACPDPLPRGLREAGNLYCVRGSPP